MGSQTCPQHPFKQPVSNYFLNILGCSLNAHVTQVSGVAICWFQRKPGGATPAHLPAWILASTSPCPSGPGLNHWLALWLRLLLHSFFWGTGFISFLVALIKYSDESLSAQVHGGKLSFTRPRIPTRGWWHPQWAALPISVNTMKIIAQISPEAHLSDDSRFCQLKDLCQFRTFRNHLMYWQPSMSPVVPPHR